MGKQSARLYYKGKDHKDIYYQGHYHVKMYKGDQLIWEKIKSSEWKKIDRDLLITFLMTYFKTSTYTKPTMVIGYGGAVEFSFKMKGAQDSELRYYDQTIRVKYKKSSNRFIGSGVSGKITRAGSSEILDEEKTYLVTEISDNYTYLGVSTPIIYTKRSFVSGQSYIYAYDSDICYVNEKGQYIYSNKFYADEGRYLSSDSGVAFSQDGQLFIYSKKGGNSDYFGYNPLKISYKAEDTGTGLINEKVYTLDTVFQPMEESACYYGDYIYYISNGVMYKYEKTQEGTRHSAVGNYSNVYAFGIKDSLSQSNVFGLSTESGKWEDVIFGTEYDFIRPPLVERDGLFYYIGTDGEVKSASSLEKMEKGTAQEPYKHDYIYDFEQDVIFHLGADGNIYMYEFV